MLQIICLSLYRAGSMITSQIHQQKYIKIQVERRRHARTHADYDSLSLGRSDYFDGAD